MPKQLDKAAVKELLRNPETKVVRNQMMDIAGVLGLFIPILGWEIFFLIAFFSVPVLDKTTGEVLASILLVLVVPAALIVAYVVTSRHYKMALTHEGMFFSHVETEDYRGPLSRRNFFVRWDEFTQLTLANGPNMTFRVKGEKYGFTVSAFLISGRARAKKHQPFVEDICAYSGYRYHLQQGDGLTWQYTFASPSQPLDFEVADSDWELF